MTATNEVNARILLWGLEGSGKTTTLTTIHDKLRPDLRGELRREPTRLDPTVFFETLPISLGELGGVTTKLELVAVPGAPDEGMTRKQLLDEVDGIVLVIDASPDRIEDNMATIDELRESLDAYGRSLETFPIVLQYNKRDIADPFAIEDLHRRIGLEQSAVFETIATTGHGILPTLTTISKYVVRARRGSSQEIDPAASTTPPQAAPEAVAEEVAPERVPEAVVAAEEILPGAHPEPHEVDALPAFDDLEEIEVEPIFEADSEENLFGGEPDDAAPASTADLLESAILAEGDSENFQTMGGVEVDLSDDALDVWSTETTETPKPQASLGDELRIVSVGQPKLDADGGVRLPLVLGDENGESRSVVLSLRLDGLLASDAGEHD